MGEDFGDDLDEMMEDVGNEEGDAGGEMPDG
jgi:hypothetical protein